jgi:heme exporter protein D
MDTWDIVLLVVAGYLAVMALVRLMLRRRDQLLDEYRRQAEAEQQRAPAAQPPGRRRSA